MSNLDIFRASTARNAVAAIALVVPVGLGWAYTAGVSVSDVAAGVGDQFDIETEDHFTSDSIDGVLIERESADGVVSMKVVDENDGEVPAEEWSDELAAEVAYFETEWEAPEATEKFFTEDGVTCYTLDLPDNPPPGEGIAGTHGDDDRVNAFWAESDDYGNWTVQAATFDSVELENALSDDEMQKFARLEIPVDEIPGGTEIFECAG